jgi:hypothetical protein
MYVSLLKNACVKLPKVGLELAQAGGASRPTGFAKAHRCRQELETGLPREAASRECRAGSDGVNGPRFFGMSRALRSNKTSNLLKI